MSLPTPKTRGYTSFRGRTACTCLAKWLPAFEAELLRRGLIKNSIDIYQLTGGAAASGGTHSQGGAFDIAQSGEAVAVARQMGADATWRRPLNWDGRGGMAHTHGVLRGCPHNAPARYQYTSTAYGVDHGHNGLANGAKDTGPQPLSGRTWEQGIAWAKAQQPKPLHVTPFRVAEQNCASDQPKWSTRVPIVAKDVTKTKPHFIAAVELYAARRVALSTLIAGTYRKSISYYGKVQYARRNLKGWGKVGSSKTYTLGDGKHAVATAFTHRTTGARLVFCTPHLDWPHDAAAHRTAEAKKLVGFLERDFKGLPWLIVGDMNDSHRPLKDRPIDSSGAVFKAAGLHDLYFDCDEATKVNREYNTANQDETPAPKSQIHIDRFWGSKELKGTGWVCHVYTGARGSDHWPVSMSIDITHPAK